jgi:hypothetical protein
MERLSVHDRASPNGGHDFCIRIFLRWRQKIILEDGASSVKRSSGTIVPDRLSN